MTNGSIVALSSERSKLSSRESFTMRSQNVTHIRMICSSVIPDLCKCISRIRGKIATTSLVLIAMHLSIVYWLLLLGIELNSSECTLVAQTIAILMKHFDAKHSWNAYIECEMWGEAWRESTSQFMIRCKGQISFGFSLFHCKAKQ